MKSHVFNNVGFHLTMNARKQSGARTEVGQSAAREIARHFYVCVLLVPTFSIYAFYVVFLFFQNRLFSERLRNQKTNAPFFVKTKSRIFFREIFQNLFGSSELEEFHSSLVIVTLFSLRQLEFYYPSEMCQFLNTHQYTCNRIIL